MFRILALSATVVGSILFTSEFSGVSAGAVYLNEIAPTPTPQMRPRTAPEGSPSPTPDVSPTPNAKPVQTIDELQAKIRQRLFDPIVRRGRVGVKIVSLNSGKIIFEQDSEKYFMPASNMKNFTVAAALEKLGPDFKFITRVYGPRPDEAGVLKGDLRIVGGGDISISTAFFGTNPDDPETYYKGIDRLVDKIVATGIKRVQGDLVGDEGFFRGFAVPGGWEWDDLQPYYGAEVSALPINDNAVDISITPGSVGGPCIVRISPPNTIFKIENACKTYGASVKRDLTVHKKMDQNAIFVGGAIPVGDRGYAGSITITHPADLFLSIVKERLAKRGIVISGQTTTVRNQDYYPMAAVRTGPEYVAHQREMGQELLTALESPPFSLIAAKTMKPSQNMYTETILWTLGEKSVEMKRALEHIPGFPDRPLPVRENSSDLGRAAVNAFLKEIGAADDGIIQYDGSGLSRHDLITPSAVVSLYTYMAKQSKNAQAWRESLTIAGVDGTLANRLKGTAAEANFRGKTGTIDQVSALSGYMTTAAGEQLVVSIIVNNVGGPTRNRTSLADDIVTALANFNGKID